MLQHVCQRMGLPAYISLISRAVQAAKKADGLQ